MSKYIDLHSIAETVNEIKEHIPQESTQHVVFNKAYCGQLFLDKSFGNRGNKYYYKCVPYDKDVPNLIIPYEKKVGFSKKVENIYVQFKYSDIISKPPKGSLLQNYGSCVEDVNYYNYLLEANDLYVSHKKIKDVLFTNNESEYDFERILSQYDKDYEKVDEKTFVFSIDGDSTRDMDDALSITDIDNGYRVDVFITNVHIWLDHFELWPFIKNMFSSVYLPHKAHTMLPRALTEKYCSLYQGTQRIVVKFSFFLNFQGGIYDFSVKNSIVNINENFVYDSQELIENNHYQKLMDVTNIVGNSIENSKDLVQFWMEKVSGFVGDRYNTGIFVRRQQSLEEIVGNIGQPFYLRSGDYLQVTSPLRKIVDLVNSICVTQPSLLSCVDYLFLDLDRLELMRKRTKKVENGCKLLDILESCGDIVSRVQHIRDDYYKIAELGKIIKLDQPSIVKIQRFGKNIKITNNDI
tara:strand:+ start:400 stop:1794 length:1395 start_codon:yes stop_codon:yes gene_type:complete